MPGARVLEPRRTLVKTVFVCGFITRSATPVVLLNEMMRPLTAQMYCVGPTAPLLSGGNEPVEFVPESVAAVKFVPIDCGEKGQFPGHMLDRMIWSAGMTGTEGT